MLAMVPDSAGGARDASGVTCRRSGFRLRGDVVAGGPGAMILVDEARWHWRGRLWAHLVSDESYEELHEFAAVLGLPHSGFQGDHYDVPSEYRQRALTLGAIPVSSRELVGRLRTAGLRRRPERPSFEA
jgi:hypothetical protein